MQAAVRDLVLGAAAEAGGSFSNLGECQAAIAALFSNLEIEFDELRQIVEILIDQGDCEKVGSGFKISAELYAQMEKQAEDSRATEERAFRDWEASVRVINPDLTDADCASLRADLDLWLEKVIQRHGVEAALILYPENPRARALYIQLDELGLSFLPKERSSAVKGIRERAIQMFVQQPTVEQRTYLSNLLNVTYFLTVLSLDPSASQLVQEHVQGHRIYLDTNVLYRALGLSKLKEVLSARRLLALAKQLGFELAVTPWTLNELKESLSRSEDSIKRRALPPRELASLMADATSQEGFITAYWRQYKEKGISPQDFFEFYSAIETLLEEDGIKVIKEGVDAVDRDKAAIERELPMLQRVLVHEKVDPVLRHDVKHRLLVERLRGSGNLTFSNARFWFLTQDSALPRYAELCSSDNRHGVPFCVSTSAWAQIMRSLVPRTDDLDQALVDLLASPYMRYRGGVSPQIVQEAVARIDQYEGVSAALASEVLLNGALLREISKTDDPQQRAEKIDNAVVRSAENLHEKIEAISRTEAEQREARRAAEVESSSSKEAVDAAHSRIRELEHELEERGRAETELSTKLGASESEVERIEREAKEQAGAVQRDRDSLEARIAAAEQQLESEVATRNRRNRIVRRVVAGTLIAIAVAGVAMLLALGAATTAWPIIGLLLGGLVLICTGIGLLAGWGKAWQLFVIAGIIIGVVAGLQQLVAGVPGGDQKSTSR